MKKEYFELTEKEVEIIKAYRELTDYAKGAIDYGVKNYPKIERKRKACTLALVVNNNK